MIEKMINVRTLQIFCWFFILIRHHKTISREESGSGNNDHRHIGVTFFTVALHPVSRIAF